VIAALLALIVGGGAGFFGQRYLAARELVGVSYGKFSLELPRGWVKSVAESQWQPPGSIEAFPALRVSESADWSARTPGVFVGVLETGKTKAAAGVDTGQCAGKGNPMVSNAEGRTLTDQYFTGCGDGDGMLLQRVVDTGTTGSMLIQVLMPGTDSARAVEIAESVRFTG
jgi:hypothetical protein